jgi:transposase
MRHETKTRDRDKTLGINGRDVGSSTTVYSRAETGGRKSLSTEARQRKETPAPAAGISGNFFVLRTGIQWKALPKEFGTASSVHECFSKWAQAGLFMRLWQEGLLSYDELHGIGWEWQSADGCMAKAPLARESAGKKGTKRSLVVESHGLPVGIAIGGANRYDIKLLEGTLQSIVTARPEGSSLCLDTGYARAQSLAKGMGYKAHIREWGKKSRNKSGPRSSRRGGG